jgi:hypothetical protein
VCVLGGGIFSFSLSSPPSSYNLHLLILYIFLFFFLPLFFLPLFFLPLFFSSILNLPFSSLNHYHDAVILLTSFYHDILKHLYRSTICCASLRPHAVSVDFRHCCFVISQTQSTCTTSVVEHQRPRISAGASDHYFCPPRPPKMTSRTPGTRPLPL